MILGFSSVDLGGQNIGFTISALRDLLSLLRLLRGVVRQTRQHRGWLRLPNHCTEGCNYMKSTRSFHGKQVWSPNVRCVPTPSSPLVTTPPHHPSSPPSAPPPSSSSLVTMYLIPSISAVKTRFRGFEKNALPTDGRTDRRTDGRTNRRTNGWTNGRTNGPTDRRMDGRTDPLIEMRGRI